LDLPGSGTIEAETIPHAKGATPKTFEAKGWEKSSMPLIAFINLKLPVFAFGMPLGQPLVGLEYAFSQPLVGTWLAFQREQRPKNRYFRTAQQP